MIPDKLLVSEHFPRSSQYHPEWTTSSVSGGANSLWLTEWLAATLDLHAACEFLIWAVDGRYCQSSFLRGEFGVLVWATDLWFNVSENTARIPDADVDDDVFPVHAGFSSSVSTSVIDSTLRYEGRQR